MPHHAQRDICLRAPQHSVCGRPQVDALLSQHGRVEAMWMPTIKNLAYVLYESADVAEDTRCVVAAATDARCMFVMTSACSSLRFLQPRRGVCAGP